MAKSTLSASGRQDSKSPKDFPLFVHKHTGRWTKKIKGRFFYFGKVADDPKGEAALNRWLDEKDDRLAGRTPRKSGDAFTVMDLCNRFRSAKEDALNAGEIVPRSYLDYVRVVDRLLAFFGKSRRVDDLASDDFEALRADIAKTCGPVTLGNEINKIRVVFRYAYESGLIDKPVRYGPTFKRPSKKTIRKARSDKGLRMFTPAEIKSMIAAASPQLRAMIQLGINAGFGNQDCGTLPISAVDLDGGWITFPRPKTGVPRRCPLWSETVTALRAALADRTKPKDEADAGLVFTTKYGGAWAKDTPDSPVSKETRKLLNTLKIHRPGLGFYALRHTFRTIGDETRDFPAIDHVMGHSSNDMGSVYRERIGDERLKAVSDHVRTWLYGTETKEGAGNGNS